MGRRIFNASGASDEELRQALHSWQKLLFTKRMSDFGLLAHPPYGHMTQPNLISPERYMEGFERQWQQGTPIAEGSYIS